MRCPPSLQVTSSLPLALPGSMSSSGPIFESKRFELLLSRLWTLLYPPLTTLNPPCRHPREPPSTPSHTTCAHPPHTVPTGSARARLPAAAAVYHTIHRSAAAAAVYKGLPVRSLPPPRITPLAAPMGAEQPGRGGGPEREGGLAEPSGVGHWHGP